VFEFRPFAPLPFGIRFATTQNDRVLEVKVDGEVMGAALVQCPTVRYAIIQASSKRDHPERLVIAYPDENCLRDLIAGPSILSAGFTSREEAMAQLVGSVPEARALKQKRRPILAWFKVRLNRDSQRGSGLRKNRRIAYRILQCTLSTITVLFYSKKLFSVMLRMALGFSS
jgi:hypothetical protein